MTGLTRLQDCSLAWTHSDASVCFNAEAQRGVEVEERLICPH